MDFATRFGLTMAGLLHAVAARGGRDRSVTALIVLLHGRLGRTLYRFNLLVAKFRAGTLTAPRPRAPRTRTQNGPAKPPPPRLPGGCAWMFRLLPHVAAAFGSQLQHLLTDEEMKAFLQAAPQARRILRPLCRILGVTLTPELLPPPPPPPSGEPKPKQTPPTGKRPTNAPPEVGSSGASLHPTNLRHSLPIQLQKQRKLLRPWHAYIVTI